MKAPKARPHLVESYELVPEGGEMKAICGVKLSRGKFVALAETDWIPGDRANTSKPRGICPNCLTAKLFTYLAVEAKDFLNLEPVEEEG